MTANRWTCLALLTTAAGAVSAQETARSSVAIDRGGAFFSGAGQAYLRTPIHHSYRGVTTRQTPVLRGYVRGPRTASGERYSYYSSSKITGLAARSEWSTRTAVREYTSGWKASRLDVAANQQATTATPTPTATHEPWISPYAYRPTIRMRRLPDRTAIAGVSLAEQPLRKVPTDRPSTAHEPSSLIPAHSQDPAPILHSRMPPH